jgi:hypothetical protein
MKKILFAIIAAVSISAVSCTSDALEQSTPSNGTVISNIDAPVKPIDSTGGQGGQTPPPRPK